MVCQTESCTFNSSIDFRRPLLFDPLSSAKSSSTSVDSLNFDDLQSFFKTMPLRTLTFVQDSSSLLSKESKFVNE